MNSHAHLISRFPVSLLRSCAPALLRSYKLAAAVLFLSLSAGSRATDADGDGMEATWESNNGLSDSNAADASLDPDGDFLTNLGEYLAKTNPNDADTYNDGVLDVYNQSLEGYWRFSETNYSYPFYPSSTANAVTGGPALTLNGASIAAGGLFGNALKPIYYMQNVNVGAVVLNGAMEWSFSGWFKMDTVQSTNVIFAARASASSTNIIGAHLSGSSWGNMTLYVTLNGNNYSCTVNIAQGSGFHHLAVSRDQQTNKADIYLDGSLVHSAAPTSSPEPLSLASGQFKISTVPIPGYTGYQAYFYGSIDEVRLYRRRLPATDVEALYTQGCTSANAAKYWTLSYLLNNPLGQVDTDNDGFTNLAEIIAGSDPQSSSSKPVPASTGYQLHTKLG